MALQSKRCRSQSNFYSCGEGLLSSYDGGLMGLHGVVSDLDMRFKNGFGSRILFFKFRELN